MKREHLLAPSKKEGFFPEEKVLKSRTKSLQNLVWEKRIKKI